jgi:ribosomal-protein-alanine N-acetyltransferase
MSEDSLSFRRMTLADVKQVMTIEREVYEFPWTERIFSDCIRVGYQCWMASVKQRIQGFGRQFIEFLVDQARAQDAQTMLLEVRPSNRAAISCYNAAGFNEIGSRKGYYPAANGREDALLFARHITPATDRLSG